MGEKIDFATGGPDNLKARLAESMEDPIKGNRMLLGALEISFKDALRQLGEIGLERDRRGGDFTKEENQALSEIAGWINRINEAIARIKGLS